MLHWAWSSGKEPRSIACDQVKCPECCKMSFVLDMSTPPQLATQQDALARRYLRLIHSSFTASTQQAMVEEGEAPSIARSILKCPECHKVHTLWLGRPMKGERWCFTCKAL